MRRLLTFAAAMLAGIGLATAQDYPARTIHLVVPGAAGGGNDIVARMLAEYMQGDLKQAVVVDNKPGAQNLIGTKFVAKAQADGYTLLIPPSISGFPAFTKEPGIEVENDFEFISLIMQAPQLFAINAALPVKTVADLVEISRRDPNRLNFASYGQLLWLHTAILNRDLGVMATHIPFSSAPDAARTVATGAADYLLGSLTPIRPFSDGGQIRLLAVTSNKRDPNNPSVPSLQEAGITMDDLTVWIALLAPRGTPQPIVQKLNAVVTGFTRDPGAAQKMRSLGFEPTATTPQQFRDMFVREQTAMTAIGRELGIKPE